MTTKSIEEVLSLPVAMTFCESRLTLIAWTRFLTTLFLSKLHPVTHADTTLINLLPLSGEESAL
jgi:hypothetical protein